jgi:ABC-type dipeptide/oligopeptide/nickel transport system permease subunit
METGGKRVYFLFKRFANLIKLFMRNTRGLIGLILVLFFVIMAFGAPLFTPYNQLGTNFGSISALSGAMAAPSWLRLLPASLGGNPTLSENMAVVKDPSFSIGNWRWPDGEWNVTASPALASALSIYRDPVLGYPLEIGNGSMVLDFHRNGTQTYGTQEIFFYKEFDYPYLGPPQAGRPRVSYEVDGTVHNETRAIFNSETATYENISTPVPDVPVQVSAVIKVPSGTWIKIWPTPSDSPSIANASFFTERFGVWVDAAPLFDVRTDIPKDGQYAIGLDVKLYDSFSNASDVRLSVHFDNLQLALYGTGWGMLGTNQQGFDIWAQLVYGARISLYVGVVAAALAVSIGLIVGLASGYLGRFVDEILMRATDVLIVLPGLPLLIVLFSVLGASIENLILLEGLLGWMGFAKLVRSQVLSLRERSYIEAAKAAGSGSGHILFRHVLPNVMGLVYVTLATSVPGAIVAEAALSFLGFYDPNRMSWGRMLEEMQTAHAVWAWWWVLPPGLCIAGISIAFVLLGYALDEVLNPRLRQRR